VRRGALLRSARQIVSLCLALLFAPLAAARAQGAEAPRAPAAQPGPPPATTQPAPPAEAQPPPPESARPKRARGPQLMPSTPLEALQRARQAFEYGDNQLVERLLSGTAGKIENAALRAEAWRLWGVALFYQERPDAASAAFIELLTIEPDEELDPFYVSPRCIAFFEQVKAEAEEALRPIRDQKRAEAEERRRNAEADAAARKRREQDEEARKLQALRPPILERRVVQREFWVSLLPFGIGQMQNGDQSLGTALATSQIVAGATSAGSALLIEALRDRSTGKFSDNSYFIASRLQTTKWIGAGLFYALWIGGAVHATLRYKPESTPTELVLPSAATPAPPSSSPPPSFPPPAPVR
jgi:hypothetical protein